MKTKRRAKPKGIQKRLPSAEAILFALLQLKRVLTALFLFALPLIIYLPNTEYGYTKSVFALVFVSLLMALWVVEMLLRKEYELKLTGLFLPALLLIVAGALSMIQSTSLGISLQSITMLAYFFLFYLFLANSVENQRELNLYLASILAAAVFAAIYGLFQYYGVLAGASGLRIISTMGNPNYLGGFLAHLFVPALVLLLTPNKLLRLFAVLSLGVFIATLIPINSDGAWLALGTSSAFLVAGIIFFRLGRLLNERKGWVIALAGVIALAFLIHSAPGPLNSLLGLGADSQQEALKSNPIKEAFKKVVDFIVQRWESGSRRWRAYDWWVGYEMLKAHPIAGIGIGHYKIHYLPYKAEFLKTGVGQWYTQHIGPITRAAQAHNEYVQIAAELGMLGIIATILLIFTIFWKSFKLIVKSASQGEKFIILACLAGVVAFMVDASVSFPLHLPASSLNLALLLGFLNSKHLDKEEIKKLSRRPIIAIATVAIILAVSVSTLAYRDFLADIHLDSGIKELKLGRYNTAKDEFLQSLKLDFAPAEALFYLGVIYGELEDYKKSREFFERSLKSFIVEPTYLHLARVNVELGDLEQASYFIEKFLALDPEPTLKFEGQYLKVFIAAQREGDKGLAKLLEFSEKHPDFEQAYIDLGRAYHVRGDKERARQYYEKAREVIQNKLTQQNQQLEALKRRGQVSVEEYSPLRLMIQALEARQKQVEELIKELGA